MKGMLRLIVLLWLIAQVFIVGKAEGNLNQGSGSRVPSARSQFAASEQAKDCSVYRAVSRRAIGQIDEYRRLKAGVVELLQKRSVELELCGRERGMPLKGDSDAAVLAEICPSEYERALVVNFRLAALDEEIRDLAQSHQQLVSALRLQCAELPEAVELEQATSIEAEPVADIR